MIIRTKYKGATNTRGSRIVATGCGMRASVAYDPRLDYTGNHVAAANALRRKMAKAARGKKLDPVTYESAHLEFVASAGWVYTWDADSRGCLFIAASELARLLPLSEVDNVD